MSEWRESVNRGIEARINAGIGEFELGEIANRALYSGRLMQRTDLGPVMDDQTRSDILVLVTLLRRARGSG